MTRTMGKTREMFNCEIPGKDLELKKLSTRNRHMYIVHV